MTAKNAEVNKVKLLLVDDHEENLIALQAILANPEYELVLCTSGKAALKELLQADFALILLDVMMPEMDGFELATLIRQRERTRHTPIIFLTAIAKEVRHIYRGYRVGAVDYIPKPLDPDIVMAKVSVFVELYRKSTQVKRQSELLRRSEQRVKEFEILQLKEENARRYRELAEAIPQIVWTTDEKGSPQYFNQQWHEYVSELNERLTIKNSTWEDHKEAFHQGDFKKFNEHWNKSIEKAEMFEFQCRLKRLYSPLYRWHLCRAVPEKGVAGEVIAWLGTWTDIHDQKQIEEQQSFLAQAAKVLAVSLDYNITIKNITELIVPYLSDWCIVDLKDSQNFSGRPEVFHSDPTSDGIVERLKNFLSDRTEAKNSSMFKVSQPTLIPSISKEKLLEMSTNNEHFDLLEQLGTKSMIAVPLEIRGEIIGSISMISGLTKRVYGEIDLKFATEMARYAALALENARVYKLARDTNRLKDEFLATVSHELRTPLNAVLGWSELLLDNTYDNDTTECLATIHRNAKNLAHLVEDLLDVSRIITGKISLNIQKTELTNLIAAAIDTVRPAASAKNIELEYIVDPKTENLTVQADPSRVQQITWNLVSNAIKFTPKGEHVCIKLERCNENDAVIKVIDDGIGVKPDFLPYIFERFRQADSTTTRRTGGLGLGLAIVKHLVELHGGNVEAHSQGEGKGTMFTVRLPINLLPTTVDSVETVEDESKKTEHVIINRPSSPEIHHSLSAVKHLF